MRSDIVHALDTDAVLAFFRPEDDEGADDEGDGHRHRLEQMRLDGLAEQQAEDGQRQKGDEQVEHETPRDHIARQAGHHAGDPGPVFPADGEYGAGLDDDFEQLAAFVIKMQQIAGQDQMTGAGNRQELGQPLDDAENQGVQQGREVHGRKVGQ